MESIQLLKPVGLVSSPAFSHVAVVPPGATTIYVGGQDSVDETGALVGDGDVVEQSTRAVANAVTALSAAGVTVADVIQWTVLFREGGDVGPAYAAIAPMIAAPEPPLVIAAFVAGLAVPGALVEVSAIAAVVR